MLPLIKYTVFRLGIFVAAMAVLYLVGARGLLNIGLAAVISLLLSYLLLRGPREALAREVAGRVERRLPAEPGRVLGLDDGRDAEDAALDDAGPAEDPADDPAGHPAGEAAGEPAGEPADGRAVRPSAGVAPTADRRGRAERRPPR